MSKKTKEERTRHSSLDNPDPEAAIKKKQDVIAKARQKLSNLSDVLKPSKQLEVHDTPKKASNKSMTQTTLDYFFRHSPNKNHVYANANFQARNKKPLTKQNSVGAYPIRIEITNEDDEFTATTVCVDKLEAPRDTEALALERPRKKLSFRIPEIIGGVNEGALKKDKSGSYSCISKLVLSPSILAGIPRNSSFNGILQQQPSCEDGDLESQAMRVVRTVGQAFEVCHKLSINAPPENDPLDQDEQDTLTQDLLSDRLSDITSDKPNKRDLISEGASDRMSLAPDDCSLEDGIGNGNKNSRPSPQIDVLPPPPHINSSRKPMLTSAETYAAPHSDALTSSAAFGTTGSSTISVNSSLPPPGGALSAHHELQLMREQLEQQQQQTREAMAQLQLVKEQLAAEQSARLEAQARTHQLLVHNRELLDHIAALVAHLQGGDKPGQQRTPPHMAMPQHHPGTASDSYMAEVPEPSSLDNNAILKALGLNPQSLIENRAVTTGFSPTSPLRSTFNPAGGVFSFSYPPPPVETTPPFETQLLQRLQALSGLVSPPVYPYPYSQTLPFLSSVYNPSLLNNNYTLQPPPQKKIPPSSLPMRNSYAGTTGQDVRISPSRNSEPRQLSNSQYQSTPTFQFSAENPYQYQQPANQRYAMYQRQDSDSLYQTQQQNRVPSYHEEDALLQLQTKQAYPPNQNQVTNTNSFIARNVSQQRERSPNPQSSCGDENKFIKPLPQMGTLTTTDSGGRLRVIVPVPSNESDDSRNLLANLKLTDTLRPLNGPAITRSTSEKVTNRSELMSEVQRTTWARHTTK